MGTVAAVAAVPVFFIPSVGLLKQRKYFKPV